MVVWHFWPPFQKNVTSVRDFSPYFSVMWQTSRCFCLWCDRPVDVSCCGMAKCWFMVKWQNWPLILIDVSAHVVFVWWLTTWCWCHVTDHLVFWCDWPPGVCVTWPTTWCLWCDWPLGVCVWCDRPSGVCDVTDHLVFVWRDRPPGVCDVTDHLVFMSRDWPPGVWLDRPPGVCVTWPTTWCLRDVTDHLVFVTWLTTWCLWRDDHLVFVWCAAGRCFNTVWPRFADDGAATSHHLRWRHEQRGGWRGWPVRITSKSASEDGIQLYV